jgi:hypothetical protein
MHVKELNPGWVILVALVLLCISIMQLRFVETQIDPPCRTQTHQKCNSAFSGTF